jgi:hypothetical protein
VAWYRCSGRGEVVGGVFLISCPGWKSWQYVLKKEKLRDRLREKEWGLAEQLRSRESFEKKLHQLQRPYTLPSWQSPPCGAGKVWEHRF